MELFSESFINTLQELDYILSPSNTSPFKRRENINDPEWVQRNPNRARVIYDGLNEQEKAKVRASNPSANRLFNPTSPAAYRAAGLPSDSSQPLHPDNIGVAIQGKEIERGEKQEQEKKKSFYDDYLERQDKQYQQTRQDRINEFNYFRQLTDNQNKEAQRRYRSPEQLIKLGENHLTFRNNLDQGNRDRNLERDKRAAKFSSDLEFQNFLRRDEVQDKNALKQANIQQASNREASLFNYSAANLREQMNAFNNASIRSNEAIQTILGQGQPNYSWIRRR